MSDRHKIKDRSQTQFSSSRKVKKTKCCKKFKKKLFFNQQPTTNNQQPTTNNQQPTTNNQQPTTNNQQPTTNNQQPISEFSMKDLIDEKYWQKRLDRLKIRLEKNNFQVYLAKNQLEAKDVVLKDIIPNSGAKQISMGDSMTVMNTGLFEDIKKLPDIEFLDTFEPGLPIEEAFERRRQALLSDLFITGTNAVTQKGQLVNLDMVGNRVGAIAHGPKDVVILVGRNKIVPDLETAMDRIKNYAAPVNAIRHREEHPELDPPCTETGVCSNCSHPLRICNTWTITEKSFPPGRIKIVLINADMGL